MLRDGVFDLLNTNSINIMSAKTQKPGPDPAIKRKQKEHSHCSLGRDEAKGVSSKSIKDAAKAGPRGKHPNGGEHRNSHSPSSAGGSSTSCAGAAARGTKHTCKSVKPSHGESHDQHVKRELTQYRLTEQYRTICAKSIRSPAELDRANALLRGIQGSVDPNAFHVCLECERATDYELCACVITVPQQQGADPLPVNPHADIGHLNYVAEPAGFVKRGLYWLMDWEKPEYHLEQQNNQQLSGFSNSIISDQKLMPDLYNYIVNNMNVSYAVHGVEQRNLRLEHAKRLASKYVEANNIDVTKDTVMSVRMRFTIQRATDQAENAMLYRETTPGQSFGQAWFPQSLVAWWRFTMLLCLIVPVFGTLIAWLSPMTIAAHLFTAIVASIVETIPWILIDMLMQIGSPLLSSHLTGMHMVTFALASVLIYQLWTQRGGSSRRR